MFYMFDQNNSGGYFISNDEHGVCEFICIEAENEKRAQEKLEDIGSNFEGFWDFCGCCGERWEDPEAPTTEPMLYDKPLAECEEGTFRKCAFVHYLDGSFEKITFKEKADV